MASTEAELSNALQLLSKDANSLLSSIQTTLPAEKELLSAPNAPSLLTLKNSALLFYLHHLVLLTSHRLRGNSLEDGTNGALLVKGLIKLRLILEKIKPVESKMRSLVERLLRAVEEDDKRRKEGRVEDDEADGVDDDAVDIDPLSFRPNIAALTVNGSSKPAARRSETALLEEEEGTSSRDRGDGIYRPPRVAPVVYDGDSTGPGGRKAKQDKRSRNSTLLSELSAGLSSNPYEASSSGIGVDGTGQNSSSRAKALNRMQAYEEDNFTRLMMSKKDANRRRRDEADVALGGAGLSTKRGRVGAGLEEEFGDLLRNKGSFEKVKRQGAMQRAKAGRGDEGGAGWEDLMGGGRSGKKNAFQKGLRAEKKRGKR
jgi:U3 small nucleolar ribonucleoprotein protein LCP5